MHDRNRRSQTRRASQPRHTRKQGSLAVSPDVIVTVSGRSGVWAWRSAGCALWVNLDAMRVKGLFWLGTPARAYAAAVRFFCETLGLEVAYDAGNTVELAARERRQDPAIGPGHRYFEFYRCHGASSVPLLEVDDLGQANAELAAGGAELLGRPESDSTWTWLTFRAPKGNFYSLGARRHSWQIRRLWSNARDMRQIRTLAGALPRTRSAIKR